MTSLDIIQQQIQSLIDVQFPNTNKKIDDINQALSDKITAISSDVAAHGERLGTLESYAAADNRTIQSLSKEIERLKQERLRNNLRITGLPSDAIGNAIKIVMKIVGLLRIELLPCDFNAYSDRNKSSIIVTFNSYSLKRCFTDAIREKRVILVEEILPDLKSNAKIYCNDQLTPYFAELFQKAWKAKKANKLIAASSLGGRIKVRKYEFSEYIVIETEYQLNEVIDIDSQTDSTAPNNTNESSNLVNDKTSTTTHREDKRNQRYNIQSSSSNYDHMTSKPKHTANNSQQQNNNRGSHRSSQFHQMKSKSSAPRYQSKGRYQHHDNGRPVDISPGQYTSPRRGQRAYSHQPPAHFDYRRQQPHSHGDYYDRDYYDDRW